LGLDRAAVGQALRLALSAWLAFAIAAALHVQYAYWAAMPVWVVAQSSRGLLLERAFFRVIGTLLGAAAGFAIMHLAVGAYAQLALLCVWIALNAGLTHVLRGVHGYGALMAGMTAAIVAVPALLAVDTSLDLAVARVECTLIGVAVTTLVTGFGTPRSRREELYERVRRLSADALAYAARAVREGPAGDVDDRDEREILVEISELDTTARLVTAGSVEGYRRLRHVDSLIVGSLSAMASAVAIGAREGDEGERAELARRLDRLAENLRAATPTTFVEERAAWATAGRSDPVRARLRHAVDRILAADADLFERAHGAEARSFGRKLIYLEPHRERRLALQTALLAGGTSFVAVALAHASGGVAAQLGALSICIIVLVLGTMAQPQLIAPHLARGMVGGVALATAYRFVVQPAISSVPELVLTIAPFLLLGGFVRASRRTALAGIDFNMGFLLASQAGGPPAATAGEILEGSAALVLGAILVAGSFIALPRRHDRLAADAASLIRGDLRRVIEARADRDPVAWHARVGRQLLRLTLHLGRAKTLGERLPRGMLAALNLGHAVGDLHELQSAGIGGASAAWTRARAQRLIREDIGEPRKTAAALRALADQCEHPPTRQVLRDL
ncbi:MAG TPA: FUSC family protein, partial [Gemmatimonadaceae bacterium]|nr:FUSC family protein [Gemmatimonadaceae bacterium]